MKEGISVDRKFHVDHCGRKRMRRGDASPSPALVQRFLRNTESTESSGHS
jgi:hypothetical protein